MQKWVWLEGNVGVVKKIARALHVLLSFGPSNLIHVPTPMYIYIGTRHVTCSNLLIH